MDRTNVDVDVLVIGAGPSGLVMAAELARHGVSCRVVDKGEGATHLSKATGVAGDAAHIHSPVGGQGLNTSIQDSYNLAWKLALVQKGLAGDALLDSYQAERSPVAEKVLRFTDRITKMLLLENSVEKSLRNHVMPLITSLHGVKHAMADQDAEVDIQYRHSPIVGEHHHHVHGAGTAAGPHAGERAPDSGPLTTADGSTVRLHELTGGGLHTLLLFPGDGSVADVAKLALDRHADLLRVVVVLPAGTGAGDLPGGAQALTDAGGVVTARYHATAGGMYLVRPDGYIGFRCHPPDAERLEQHLVATLALTG